MPLYGYRCRRCKKNFDILKSVADYRRVEKCPDCRKKAVRVLTAPMIGAIVGAGDKTNILMGEDNGPYRFKSGDKKGQRKEIVEQLNKQQEAAIKRGHLTEAGRLTFDSQ